MRWERERRRKIAQVSISRRDARRALIAGCEGCRPGNNMPGSPAMSVGARGYRIEGESGMLGPDGARQECAVVGGFGLPARGSTWRRAASVRAFLVVERSPVPYSGRSLVRRSAEPGLRHRMGHNHELGWWDLTTRQWANERDAREAEERWARIEKAEEAERARMSSTFRALQSDGAHPVIPLLDAGLSAAHRDVRGRAATERLASRLTSLLNAGARRDEG